MNSPFADFRYPNRSQRLDKSSIECDKEWLKKEFAAAQAMYEHILEEVKESGDEPDFLITPDEFMQNPEHFVNKIDEIKISRLREFETKWKAELDYEEYLRQKKQLYWTRTEEEREAAFLEEERQVASGELVLPTPPGPEFEEDRAIYRKFINSTIMIYLSLLVELYKTLRIDFPELRFDWEI